MRRNKFSKSYLVKSLPTQKLFEIFERVVSLKNQGHSIRDIKAIIFEEYGVTLRKNTIYRWATGRNRSDRNMNKFIIKPSPELSYVIGVFLGDGSIYWKVKDYKYSIKLKVKDKDFAETFAKNIAKLLNKDFIYSVRRENDFTRGNRIRFSVDVGSKMLFEFLSHSTNKLLSYVEPYISEFLRGLFDSDGFTAVSAQKGFNVGAGLVSTDERLLNFVKSLLMKNFGIHSHISLNIEMGRKVKIWGKEYVANKNVFSLTISSIKDVEKFCNEIGFSLQRKQCKLVEALIFKQTLSDEIASNIWKENYVKKGREWVKRSEVDSGGSPETSF